MKKLGPVIVRLIVIYKRARFLARRGNDGLLYVVITPSYTRVDRKP